MTRRHFREWMMLAALTVMWGSAFMFTKIAVTELPPPLVVAGRLIVAALLLCAVIVATRRRLPRSWRVWISLALIALVGNVTPFWLITWGQQTIDSGVAGILMAVMPLVIIVLAHFFVAGERLTIFRITGFVLGFSGIVVLTGPGALTAVGSMPREIITMLAVLGGAVCYGVATIISRLRPAHDAVASAAGMMLIAAAVMLPVVPLEIAALISVDISMAAIASVVVLGVLSTALPAVVYFRLIESAGPNFVSYLNYLIPPWAVLLGILFLNEKPALTHLFALLLILAGIAVSHFRSDRRTTEFMSPQQPLPAPRRSTGDERS